MQPQTQPSTASATRAAALTLTALALLALGTAPAAARPEAGPPVGPAAAVVLVRHTEQATDDDECRLRRVAAQFTRCDALTGNGVPAPAWIPER